MLAGHLTQSYLLKKHGQKVFQKEWAPRFPPFSTLGVLGIVFVAMALKAQQLAAHPAELLNLILPLLRALRRELPVEYACGQGVAAAR